MTDLINQNNKQEKESIKEDKFRDKLTAALKLKRNKITDSSLKTYTSLLYNILKKNKGKEEILWFDTNHKKIIKFIIDNVEKDQ